MSEWPDDESLNDFSPRDEIDAVLGYGHPNPERTGCPPPEVLRLLARRKLPIEHCGYDHLGQCSPCYRRVRVLKARHQHRVRLAGASVLVVAIAGFIGLRYWNGGVGEPGGEPMAGAGGRLTSAVVTVTIDLRRYSVTRSDAAPESPPAIRLPRARLDLTILLPVGSEPGEYEMQLLDAGSNVVASVRAEAAMVNFVTTCRSVLDLGHAGVTPHVLRIRRIGGEWRDYAVLVN